MTRRDDDFNRQYLAYEAWLDERDAELLDEIAADRLEASLASGTLEMALANLKRKRRLDNPAEVEGVDLSPAELARRPGIIASEAAQGVVRVRGPQQADLGLNGEVKHYAPPPKPKQPSAIPAVRVEQAATLFDNPEEQSP